MKFNDITGHENIKERLRMMVASDRIPHAILFEGPEGVGKLAMARAFAQYIHCTNRTADGQACGICPSCLQHQNFNHADLFYAFPIFKTGSKEAVCDEFLEKWNKFLDTDKYADFKNWVDILNPGSTQPRIYNYEGDEIIRKLTVKSYSTRYKIMIMWLPEKMTEECSNHILKMVEEPYEDTLLFFVSNNSNQIIPTIYSRVQRISMKRLPNDLVAQYLTDNKGVNPQDALSVANMSGGSIIKAMNLLEVDEDTQQYFEFFKRLMRSAYKKDLRDLKDWSEEVTALKREKSCACLTYIAKMIRENFIYNLHNKSLNYMTSEEEAFSTRFYPFINERNVEGIIYEIDRAIKDIAGNGNGKIVLFDFAIRIVVAIRK